MAAQKAEAQKRLLKPTRRAEGDVSDLEKKRISAEKKKDDLVRHRLMSLSVLLSSFFLCFHCLSLFNQNVTVEEVIAFVL